MLENPSTLDVYRNAFPTVMKEFIDNLILFIQRKKWTVLQRKQTQRQQFKEFDDRHATKISTFLVSVILTVAFPNTKVWITHMLSSLSQKPNMQSSLYTVLCTANIVLHSMRYERKLEKERRSLCNPKERLLKGD